MVICLEQGADLHMARLMPLTVLALEKIQIGFTFLVLAHLGSTGKWPLNGCVYVCVVTIDRACNIVLNAGKKIFPVNYIRFLQLVKSVMCS